MRLCHDLSRRLATARSPRFPTSVVCITGTTAARHSSRPTSVRAAAELALSDQDSRRSPDRHRAALSRGMLRGLTTDRPRAEAYKIASLCRRQPAPNSATRFSARTTAERFVRTVRSECLDWLMIVSARHLERALTVFIDHYNTYRPHCSLDLAPPHGRPVMRSGLARTRWP